MTKARAQTDSPEACMMTTRFDIAGEKYRLVTWINFPWRVVYVRFVGTHTQYDRIDAQII